MENDTLTVEELNIISGILSRVAYSSESTELYFCSHDRELLKPIIEKLYSQIDRNMFTARLTDTCSLRRSVSDVD